MINLIEENNICDLCKRKVPKLTKHHLIPMKKEKSKEVISLCVPCHKQLHALYSNYELSYRLNSLSRINAEEKIKRYLKFIRTKPGDAIISIKKSKALRIKGRYY